MSARQLGAGALFALLALQVLWYAWLAPPGRIPPGAAIALALLPLALPAAGVIRGRPMALFWAAVMALFYFCHGVMEAWTTPAVRLPALLEVLLSLSLILAVGADGWQRRRRARAVAAAEHPSANL